MNFLSCDCKPGRGERVIDSRLTFVGFQDREIPTIRRRRMCDGCGTRATTYEVLATDVGNAPKPGGGQPHILVGRSIESMTVAEILDELQQREAMRGVEVRTRGRKAAA